MRHRFQVLDGIDAILDETPETRIGDLWEVHRTPDGVVLTPIATFFTWKPKYTEGFKDHWRIDCFAKTNQQSPTTEQLAVALKSKLVEKGLCDLPLWVSWHASTELGGEAYGELFED